MNSIIESITPEKAQAYLFTSQGNRPISKPMVRSYADTMKAGKWMLNGIPIVFDEEGQLIDGHHRLNAVILAGVPVQMSVARGVEKGAFVTFDCGLHRTLGQLLAMQGKKNYNTAASIVLVSENLRVRGKIWKHNADKEKRTNLDNYNVYSRDPEGYDEATCFATKMSNSAKVLRSSLVGGMYYYLTRFGGYEKDFVSIFFENLCSLSTSKYSSIELLRCRIINDRMRGDNMDTSLLFALVVKSWNAYVTGKKVGALRFNPEKEPYPSLILNTILK